MDISKRRVAIFKLRFRSQGPYASNPFKLGSQLCPTKPLLFIAKLLGSAWNVNHFIRVVLVLLRLYIFTNGNLGIRLGYSFYGKLPGKMVCLGIAKS